MSSQLVIWILAWMLIIFVIRFRLTNRPLRHAERKSFTINNESLKFLQQYWSSQLPVCARKVADVDSYLLELLPEHLEHKEFFKKCLNVSIEDLEKLHGYAQDNPGQAEYILCLVYRGIFNQQLVDLSQAEKWLCQAAEHGDALAMFALGQREIIETMRDENTDTWQIASAYFTRAAEKKLAEAKFMVANVLMANTKDHFSREEILEVMGQAAAMNHPVANFVMALVHLIDEPLLLDKTKSRGYFEKLNGLAYPSGQTYFAELILGSEVFQQDHVLAFQLLHDARKSGYIAAGIPLGRMYEVGDLPKVEREQLTEQEMRSKSLLLYRSSAVQGNYQAFFYMIRLYNNGGPIPDYDAELNYWFQFEKAETSKSHLAIHFYLAWIFVNQHQSEPTALTVIENLLKTLHIPFEEFDFDQGYQSIRESLIDPHYSGFLQWLMSDFCESVYRKEHSFLLELAASKQLRVAQLTIIDPESTLGLTFEISEKYKLMQSQAKLGCGAASLYMFNAVLESADGDISIAIDWLNRAVTAKNTDALLRLAALQLQQFDYNEFDEKLRTIVMPDPVTAVKYLQQAAESSQQAASLLENFYLSHFDVEPNIQQARYYHRYAIINFGDEEQYVQSFIKSLVRVAITREKTESIIAREN
ncbi:hypothetical protein MNBD_GAMMA12-454 [hydrothermal vent metagenome]|uniref:Sel1 repeat family protein n=1 Tax=hydrothermal vent metagenome TaxID=652676 RepID=A0A3B0YUX4_9ZZZZ